MKLTPGDAVDILLADGQWHSVLFIWEWPLEFDHDNLKVTRSGYVQFQAENDTYISCRVKDVKAWRVSKPPVGTLKEE
jgi:hypothetical protein